MLIEKKFLELSTWLDLAGASTKTDISSNSVRKLEGAFLIETFYGEFRSLCEIHCESQENSKKRFRDQIKWNWDSFCQCHFEVRHTWLTC